MAEKITDETIVASITELEGLQQKKPAMDILGGPAMGQQILLEEGDLTWGRSREADVFVEDEAISRYHFKVSVRDRLATIEDLGSTNGTYINGKRVERQLLQSNDKIQISSNTVLRFSYVDPIDTDVHQRFYEMALFDPVTQAHTKRYFLDRIQHEVAYSKRKSLPLSLIIFDLDHFKNVNDTYGHPAGDCVLQRVAELTQEMIRTEDVFARYGGEEFVILMRDAREAPARALAERLREAVEKKLFEFEGQMIPVRISAGVACCSDKHAGEAKDLIQWADQALYYSKNNGRNQVAVYEEVLLPRT